MDTAQVSASGRGPWRPLVPGSTPLTTIGLRARPGASLAVRARAVDSYGNVGPYATLVVTAPFDESIGRYSHNWRRLTRAGRYGTGVTSTSRAGATVTFAVRDRTTSLIGDKGPGAGAFAVSVDGHQVGVVDAKAATFSTRQTLWTSKRLRFGRHVVKVVALGTSGRPAVTLDGIVARP